VATATKLKVCKEFVKENGEKKVCDLPYTGDRCKNKDNHVWKMRSGFCEMGQHEGTKPRSASGKPMVTCKFFATCGCKCHDDLDLLFRMSGKDRIEPVVNPEWAPEPREFWLPSDDWNAAQPISRDAATPAPVRVESPAPDLVPATTVHTFSPTPTGRAARGELESWVKVKCDEWLIENYKMLCTPAWLAEEIAYDQAIKAPSVGAISAIFDRWVKLGFARVAKKPTRFLGYTDEGRELGLDGLKARAKRARDMARSEQRRGIR
jgi:hypothetical protein